MHVLVTGGLGHIGSGLIRSLAENITIQAITILDNLYTQRYASLFNLPSGVDYTFLDGDILEPADVDIAMQGINAVVHLAAITDAEGSFDNLELVETVNYDGTRSIIQACIRHGIQRMIFPSTTSVYGPVNGLAREDCDRSELIPQSPYATSKLNAEDEVLAATSRGELSGVVLRLGTIFGPSPGMRFHTAINKFVLQAVMGKPLTIWSEAVNLVRPYLALEDCVKAIEFILERPDISGQVLNVVTINATLDRIISELRNSTPEVETCYTHTRLLNQVSYEVDDSKIRDLGFSYSGELGFGISQTVKLLRSLTKSR